MNAWEELIQWLIGASVNTPTGLLPRVDAEISRLRAELAALKQEVAVCRISEARMAKAANRIYAAEAHAKELEAALASLRASQERGVGTGWQPS